MQYTKTHSSPAALKAHTAKIKARKGTYSISGNTITYSFGATSYAKGGEVKKAKYDTAAKRIAFVKKPGKLVTFKVPFEAQGMEGTRKQIASTGLEKNGASVRLTGKFLNTPWYKSMDELIAKIDWDQMEAWH